MRRYGMPLLRAVVTVGAIAYVANMVDGRSLLAAFARVDASAWAIALALFFASIVLGAQRWRVLLGAFGAPHPPPITRLLRIYLVGLFYSTCVPGGIGGDLVRAAATRRELGSAGATGSLAVIFVERVLGMAGLLLLAGSVALFGDLPDARSVELGAGLGLAGALFALIAVTYAHKLAPSLPGPLRRLAERIPTPHRHWPLFAVMLIAVLCHTCAACGGHALLRSMAPGVPLSQSLAIIPVAAAAAFLPFTMAGIGVREAAFVALYARVGVPEADALVVSFGVLGCNFFWALLGGLIELISPLQLDANGTEPAPSPRA
jgi:glycosyltransferase 2 family protein